MVLSTSVLHGLSSLEIRSHFPIQISTFPTRQNPARPFLDGSVEMPAYKALIVTDGDFERICFVLRKHVFFEMTVDHEVILTQMSCLCLKRVFPALAENSYNELLCFHNY